jgi:Flp pilus assembly protein TadD
MFVSTDARTFEEPPPTWAIGTWRDPRTFFADSPQSLAGDLIREGATGVSGHVSEPYLDATVRPQILFPAYASGLNLAESFYAATPYLSWQNVVIGDPLCAPFRTGNLPPEEQAPPLDPETELPRFFSARRLEVLAEFGVKPRVATLVLKASAQLSRGDVPAAIPSLEEVTKLEPTLNAAHFVLAGLYERAGQHDRAVERYRTILTTAPDEVRSMNNLAYLLAVSKHAPGEALPLAEKAYSIANDPNAVVDLDLGASLLAGRGTPVGAMPFSLDSYDLFAVKAQISDTVGWIYHLLGNNDKAEPYLLEASKGAPFSAEVHVHLATVQAALRQSASAIATLDRAISLDPTLAERPDVRKLNAALGR